MLNQVVSKTLTRPVLPDGTDRIARFRPNERWRYAAGWNFSIVNELRTNNAGWVSDIHYVREADSPLVAVVGDSYVEAVQVPWRDTCHGGLRDRLERKLRVYSFGMSAAPLTQYLAYAEHARDVYRPAALVIPIIENDFDQSLRQVQAARRHTVFFRSRNNLMATWRSFRPRRCRRCRRVYSNGSASGRTITPGYCDTATIMSVASGSLSRTDVAATMRRPPPGRMAGSGRQILQSLTPSWWRHLAGG